MPHFVYYTPTPGRPDPRALGVGHALERAPAFVLDAHGPDGGRGVLFGAAGDGLGYAPDRQTWARVGERCWVGMERESPPEPADLVRQRTVDGRRFVLADGREWLVPKLRSYLADVGFVVALPCRAQRVDGCWVQGPVLPEWEHADAVALRLMEMVLTPGVRQADALDLVADLLQINYRVGREELGLLGALPIDGRLGEVVRYSSDVEGLEARGLGEPRGCGPSPSTGGGAGSPRG